MRVWILQTGEPLHSDSGRPRPMRAMNLTNALVARGHEVVLWSSGFSHIEKKHRARTFKTVRVSGGIEVNLIPSSGYRRNIGLSRLIDHAQLGINLASELRRSRRPLPDVAFVGFPPIETAAVMGRWLRRSGVPFVLDAKDQWPDIFVEAMPKWTRRLARLALAPYFRLARRAMRDADAYCAMSDEFVAWMCEVSGRGRRSVDVVAPLTTPRLELDSEAVRSGLDWWARNGVDPTHSRRVAFVGSLSSAFNFGAVRDLAVHCSARGLDCQFVICGDGDQALKVTKLLSGLSGVVMPGWIDHPRISALMQISSATVAPYINNDAFRRSIPNKIIDSLANGLPIITTLGGAVERLLHEESVGFSGPPDGGADFLNGLLTDRSAEVAIRGRARRLYDARFSSDAVYGHLVSALEGLASR